MFNARRVYVYLVSLISFAAAILAVISLLQKLLLPNFFQANNDVALQIAILIIAVPIYLGHWSWGERRVAQDEEERGALLRRVYLYLIMGGAVVLAAVNAYDLLEWLLSMDDRWQALVYYLIPLVIASGVWLYHLQLLRRDEVEYPNTGLLGAVHRTYLYAFSAAGLVMTSLATVELLRWLFSSLGDRLWDAGTLGVDVRSAIPQIVVGIVLWLIYWLTAQRLFESGDAEERRSVLRKFYLYAAIFAGVAGGVSAAALVLSGVFRVWLGLPVDGDIRNSLAWIIMFAALWFYHSQVLTDDARAADHTAQQADIRRIYLYLLSGVGLVALLVGLIGDISTLLYVVDDGMSDTFRELLAYFSAALIAGLPVWALAWRKAQQEASRQDRTGSLARDSLVRKIYLYIFLFVSIMSVLGSAIFVIYRLLQWLLFRESLTLIDVAIPLTIAAVQLFVWFYHLSILRTDRTLTAQQEVRQLADMRLALIDGGDSETVQAIAARLRRAAPGLHVTPIQAGAADTLEQQQSVAAQLEQAEVIVAPWSLYLEQEVAASPWPRALAHSAAHKIVLPDADPCWHWVGMEELSADDAADETLNMLRRIVSGEEIKGRNRLGCGAIALIIVGAIVLFGVLMQLMNMVFMRF